MRCVWIAVTVALLLVACHHGGQGDAERTDTGRPEVCVADAADTADGGGGSSDSSTARDMLIPQRDTADTTNWLFFWRKQRKIYSPSMLLGESLNGREHEVYMSSGRGLYWDTADDVSRKEARVFHWTMDSNLLRRVYPLSMGVEVTRLVVVTFIDDESLVYRDDYGQSYMWDKVTGNVSPGESAGR